MPPRTLAEAKGIAEEAIAFDGFLAAFKGAAVRYFSGRACAGIWIQKKYMRSWERNAKNRIE
ncbi:MAG: hypothetical protein ACLTSZ_17135 [Lachnospiraceae bacterium]